MFANDGGGTQLHFWDGFTLYPALVHAARAPFVLVVILILQQMLQLRSRWYNVLIANVLIQQVLVTTVTYEANLTVLFSVTVFYLQYYRYIYARA